MRLEYLISTAAVAFIASCGDMANAQTPPAIATPVACLTGAWSTVELADNKPVQYQTAHFVFRWKTGDVQMADAVSASQELELIWTTYLNKVDFPEPFCDSSDKHKVNINIDPTFGLSGGPTGDRDMGMWIGPLALKDHWGLGHEFTHALQGSTRGLRDGKYVGWMWESHANWMAHQLDEYHHTEVHCSEMLVNYPYLYYGSTRDRYCNWQFFEYLKDTYGYKAVNDIWVKTLKPNQPGYLDEDPFSVLALNQGWSIVELNDAFGRWALHNVTWDYIDPDGHDEGALYRQKYGSYDIHDPANTAVIDRALRVTALDPIDLASRRFAVPADWAPQRWGYNIVRLMPDAGATEIMVKFRGIPQDKPAVATLPGLNNEPAVIADPDSDWRWGVVAITADGTPRYSPLVAGEAANMTFKLKPGDRAIYMVVIGTPSTMQKIQWDQAYYSLYRYPWMVELADALPQGFEAGAPNPTAHGHRHANGGGWIADGAYVDSTAYVGPYAEVLGGSVTGHARIEDHAVVNGGRVSDNAIVGALSVISDGVTVKDHAVVKTIFKGVAAFEPGTVVGGTAEILGDAEVRGGPTLTKGVYYGFIDQSSSSDPLKGANLTARVPEVTATPDFTWRP